MLDYSCTRFRSQSQISNPEPRSQSTISKLRTQIPESDLQTQKPDPRIGSLNREPRSQQQILNLQIQNPPKYPLVEMNSDCERSSVALEGSTGKSRQQSSEKPEEEEYYTVILDEDEKGYSDLNAQITLLNQYTRKLLSVITTEEEFLSSIQKFTSP